MHIWQNLVILCGSQWGSPLRNFVQKQTQLHLHETSTDVSLHRTKDNVHHEGSLSSFKTPNVLDQMLGTSIHLKGHLRSVLIKISCRVAERILKFMDITNTTMERGKAVGQKQERRWRHLHEWPLPWRINRGSQLLCMHV